MEVKMGPRFGADGKVPLHFLLNAEDVAPRVESVSSPLVSAKTMPPADALCGGGSSRKRWSSAEDEILAALVAKHGARNWEKLATCLPDRNGNQLRLRWNLHLSPSVQKISYTPAEDEHLLQLHSAHGNNWKLIVSLMNTSRSVNDVKNRYHILSRRMRKASSLSSSVSCPIAA
eukprot:CAMPEP_0185832210 /NCGR_PEP_ID=MMETSP1353-20130828/1950_1 /TAXON_ID=1077150 /ORGANISM="Erythrolobus australicus, Strain CCMP3124" /LENGTH=173 /DNA_ID=CAMNT_0028530361 /DNA_START=103 /DNA_END=624 /DNA_ORIENTATION=+